MRYGLTTCPMVSQYHMSWLGVISSTLLLGVLDTQMTCDTPGYAGVSMSCMYTHGHDRMWTR